MLLLESLVAKVWRFALWTEPVTGYYTQLKIPSYLLVPCLVDFDKHNNIHIIIIIKITVQASYEEKAQLITR